ncbi:MAG: sulfate permease [Deltaproteobacteria bacterium]|nr:sulfate permease [Deltaproteobacteria bacterium]
MSERLPIKDRLAKVLPILRWLPEYKGEWLRADLMAGMTLAAFTVPEAMAYAGLAGLPPQAGLYAAITAPLVYTVLGTSRQLAVGPTSAVSVLVASGLQLVGAESTGQYIAMASMTAILMGCFALLAYLLRLGFVVNFISESVLVGFSSGAALYIASTQVGKLFGIPGGEGEFFERIVHLARHLEDSNPWAIGMGLGGILLLLAGEHLARRVPWALILVFGSITVMTASDLGARGIHVVGEIPVGLPTPVFPHLAPSVIRSLLPTAFAAFVLAYIEGMSMARSYASGHRYRVDTNQELLALGFACLGAGVTRGYPVAGSFSRTALSDAAGSRTPLAGGFSALWVVLVLEFLTGFFARMPEPVLASVVIVAVRGLFKLDSLRCLHRLRRREFWTATAALTGVLFLGILAGVLVGVLLSLLLVIWRASQARMSILGRVPGRLQFSDIRDNPENITIPGLCILRFDEGIFYANAQSLREQVLKLVDHCSLPVRTVVVDLELTSDLDIPGVEMLEELHKDLQDRGIRLRLSRLQPSTRDLLDKSGVTETIGPQNIHSRTIGAVSSYLNEEATHLQENYDILPDLVKRMEAMVAGRADHTDGEDQDRLKAVGQKIGEIMDILKARSRS